MLVEPEIHEIHRRIRFSFDVDVTYRKLALDPQDVELSQLRERLLANPGLLEKLLANQALSAVEIQLENRLSPTGLLDFTSADLLDAAAHSAPAAETIPLLVSKAGGSAYSYTQAILDDSINAEVTGMQASDLSSGRVIDLTPPSEGLECARGKNYLVGLTAETGLAAVTVYHTSTPSMEWVRETRRTIDRLVEAARRLPRPLTRAEFTIYASTHEDYQQVRSEIEWYCRARMAGVLLSFGWFTTAYRLDPALLRESARADR